MPVKSSGCPFCGRALAKDARTCGRAACLAKSAVWAGKGR